MLAAGSLFLCFLLLRLMKSGFFHFHQLAPGKLMPPGTDGFGDCPSHQPSPASFSSTGADGFADWLFSSATENLVEQIICGIF
jgi:hypothetical protein